MLVILINTFLQIYEINLKIENYFPYKNAGYPKKVYSLSLKNIFIYIKQHFLLMNLRNEVLNRVFSSFKLNFISSIFSYEHDNCSSPLGRILGF